MASSAPSPVTNPRTIINNSISMISAGNAVVYNPHPAAKRASQKAMELLNEAIVKAGGPNGLMTAAKEPTLDTSKVIMTHKAIKMLAVTGGEAVVGVAMKSGKKCVAAGPGNPLSSSTRPPISRRLPRTSSTARASTIMSCAWLKRKSSWSTPLPTPS